jgi:hypothetical protein
MSEPEKILVLRELIVRADSLLSLLWYRHVPPDRKDSELRRDVENAIGDLRDAYEHADQGRS